jgi:carboxyl-terminal processing protease
MFKRLLVLTAAAVLLGQLFVVGVNHVRVGSFFSRSEASKKAAEFEKVLKLINENYVSPDAVSYQDLATTAFEAIPRSLDPHSEFLSGDEFENFKADASQEFGGIGVRIEMRDDHVTVVAPIGGTPGERAGLMRGDQVKKVDGVNVVGKSLDDCLKLLRGKPGNKLHLTMFRPRTNETYECEIVREAIQPAAPPAASTPAMRKNPVRSMTIGGTPFEPDGSVQWNSLPPDSLQGACSAGAG